MATPSMRELKEFLEGYVNSNYIERNKKLLKETNFLKEIFTDNDFEKINQSIISYNNKLADLLNKFPNIKSRIGDNLENLNVDFQYILDRAERYNKLITSLLNRFQGFNISHIEEFDFENEVYDLIANTIGHTSFYMTNSSYEKYEFFPASSLFNDFYYTLNQTSREINGNTKVSRDDLEKSLEDSKFFSFKESIYNEREKLYFLYKELPRLNRSPVQYIKSLKFYMDSSDFNNAIDNFIKEYNDRVSEEKRNKKLKKKNNAIGNAQKDNNVKLAIETLISADNSFVTLL